MVTLQKIGSSMNRAVLEISGLSTDEKPVNELDGVHITNGSVYEEIDTGTTFKYNETNKEWIEQPATGLSGGNISLDYSALTNKPQIAGIELDGNKTLDDLGIQKKGNYLTKEADPTVPAWAKESKKPSYTADEVGALPKTTTALPNPKKIKFTGAVTDEYDGSAEKTINIPKQSTYSLPQANEAALGGVKAKTKTSETVEVAIDATTGKLFVPTYPVTSDIELDKTLTMEGKAADAKAVGDAINKISFEIPEETVTSTTYELKPNVQAVWGEVTELNLTLGTPKPNMVNIYPFWFTSGATATRITLPSNILLDGFVTKPNTKYMCQIEQNVLFYKEIEVTA